MDYLVLWEVSKKQNYIFNSNRLKENIGASLIIKYVTEEMPKKYLKNYDAEPIIEGGGKTLYKFKKENESKEFIKCFTRDVLKEYTTLELFVVKLEFNGENDNIAYKIQECYEKLSNKKEERKNSSRLISFGIEEKCASTSNPASCRDKEDGEEVRFSKESCKKVNFAKEHEDINFNHLIPKGYKITTEINDLVKKDDNKSYVAIIHIDGNKMGKMFENFNEFYEIKENENVNEYNKKYIKEMKGFSDSIKRSYDESFIEMSLEIQKKKEELEDITNINEKKFPIRPLIVAGDDICFITNGYIGIQCAKVFISNLNKKKIKVGDKKVQLHACAGIAIVKHNYPFFKAYKLAEELCSNCKKYLIENSIEKISMIDWHIEQGEIGGDLNSIREGYKIGEYQLNMRPLFIKNPCIQDKRKEEHWNNYDNFIQALNNITRDEKGRNKIKKLREVLREGPVATENFIKANKLDIWSKENENIINPLLDTTGNYGFNLKDKKCMYFDAIEIMDILKKEIGEE